MSGIRYDRIVGSCVGGFVDWDDVVFIVYVLIDYDNRLFQFSFVISRDYHGQDIVVIYSC